MLNGPDLLKQARLSAGLTQTELADRLGVRQSEVARLEKRGANPRLRTLVDAIRATGHALEAEVKPSRPGIDETMIAANLRMPPVERLRQFAVAYNSVRELAPSRRGGDGPEGQASS